MSAIVCFGEVLWDIFPTHNKIGGAPLNVALRLDSLKNKVAMISSVGNDAKGNALLKHLDTIGFDTSKIQINQTYKTGEVLVSLDQRGGASFSIEFPSAWDYIGLEETLTDTVKRSDAFVFGSLVARNKVSYNTLLTLLESATFKVFDVNLRPPHYNLNVLVELMQKANFIKFNDDELYEICEGLQFKSDDLQKNIEFIAIETNTESICVTRGENGAVLYLDRIFYSNEGYAVKVIDTVGAGDSFLASLIDKILKKESPQAAVNFACAVGALVASNIGANPSISNAEILGLIEG